MTWPFNTCLVNWRETLLNSRGQARDRPRAIRLQVFRSCEEMSNQRATSGISGNVSFNCHS